MVLREVQVVNEMGESGRASEKSELLCAGRTQEHRYIFSGTKLAIFKVPMSLVLL